MQDQSRTSQADAPPVRMLTVGPGEPLIGLPVEDDQGNVTVLYFANEDDAEVVAQQLRTRAGRPRTFAGIWSDLDGNAMDEALDRIRHESVPTPPIDDL